ncbi:MAG: CotH kinase family protein [Bacteroidota bacterium]
MYRVLRLFALFTGILPAASAFSQIVINEISSASTVGFVDEENEQEDWIELYNASGTAVNLQGYTFTYSEGGQNITNWTFPSVFIQPNDYLTVFCSEKNRTDWFDHWEVPVYPQLMWRYFLGTTDPPSTWREITFNDSGWPTGDASIGYGDGDDSTITPPLNSVFMRTSFTIADTSKIAIAALLADFDDGFVAYLNDVEIARENVGIYGDHPLYNVSAYDEHEAQMYQNGNLSGIYFVSADVVNQALKPGTNVLSIQVHNYSSGLDDLTMIPYFIIGVIDTTVTYYPIPAAVNLHTNFNLDSDGFFITLKNPSGIIADQQTVGKMMMNNTRGRFPDGNSNWCLFDIPSPDTTNTLASCFSDYASAPVFSLEGGFYPGTQLLTLSSSTPGTIRYTIDGSEPLTSSLLYSTSITIDSSQVIRARVYPSVPNTLPGQVVTKTYFINESSTMPVISLTSDPFNLFDWNYGIYVLGPNADTVNIPYFGANFWNEWERPAVVEYFDENGMKCFETSCGIKIQGNFSKAWPQRGFSVKVKDNYGGNKINYRLFPDKGINEFKSFNIRNAGSDWNTCHMRDRLVNKSVQQTHIDIMDGRSCLLFINGQYWGVYELRERQNDQYIEDNSGVPKENIDFLEFDGSVKNGSNQGFIEMATFAVSNDLSQQQNYDSMKVMLDIENFCDYFITETYVVNIDWLGSYTNNIKYWRPNNPEGKFRYVLWDTDLSLGFASAWGGYYTLDMLDVAINPTTWNPHSGMLLALLANAEFKNYFINRYADLMNTCLHPVSMENMATGFHDEMLPEMTRHFNRWGNQSPWPGLIGRANNVPEWEIQIDTLFDFLDNRITYARYYVQQQFALNNQVNVTLQSQPAEGGKVQISTITPGPLPWSGVYYDGNPVSLTAIPQPGYRFLYWKSDDLVTTENDSVTIRLNISEDETFTAYFEKLGNYFEVYPNPFSDQLTLVYDVPSEQQVEIAFYNVLGQKSAIVVSPSAHSGEGRYTLTIDPNAYGISAGTYFVHFRGEDFEKTVKVVCFGN